jgi:ADP-heptose:LPS heptosyltransferase
MSDELKSLAIFKTNFLGDNVVFVPVVQALRRLRPGWRITLITSPREAPLYAKSIPEGDLLTVESGRLKKAWRNPLEFGGWVAELRRRKVDASYLGFDQSSAAHLIAWAAGGGYRVGGDGLRTKVRGTLTKAVPCGPGWSSARWNWEMMRALLTDFGGADGLPEEPPAPDLSHLTAGVERLHGRIVIHAGSKWEHTRWPLDRFAELAGRLARDHEVVWINVPETRGSSLAGNVGNQECADIGSLARLLSSAALFVGNNSGPMHLANAVGTPLVAIAGASALGWNPGWHRQKVRVIRTGGLACAPCETIQHTPGRCLNTGEPLACLRRIDVDAVEAECRGVLGNVEANR